MLFTSHHPSASGEVTGRGGLTVRCRKRNYSSSRFEDCYFSNSLNVEIALGARNERSLWITVLLLEGITAAPPGAKTPSVFLTYIELLVDTE